MENSVEVLLRKYYSQDYNEDSRLTKDRAHQIEFITTTKYIEKYLKKGDKILEIGAGTGAYSIYYAKQGYEVNSVDLIEENLNILKTKIKENMKIRTQKANAVDLGIYEDNTFDITLCLGPLYHLFSEKDRKKAIAEAIRVTKPEGIVYFAYIANDAVILSYGLRKGHILDLKRICDENYKIKDIPEEIFAANYVEEFEEVMKDFPVQKLHQVGADGISGNVAEYINHLSEEEYQIWLDYHLHTCERKDLIGYSSHILYIAKKNK